MREDRLADARREPRDERDELDVGRRDGHDARFERDLVAAEAVGVAGAVEVLVVVTDRVGGLAQPGHAAHDLLADHDVVLDQRAVGGLCGTNELQQAIRDRDGAEVAQPRAEAAAHHHRAGELELFGDRRSDARDLLAVRLGQALASARREREGARQAQRLGLLGDEVFNREVAEQLGAVAASALRGVERAVCRIDDGLGRAQALARPSGTDRDRDRDRDVTGDGERDRADQAAHVLGDLEERLVVADAGHEHDELLAAPAADHVVAAHAAAQAVGDLDEHLVACAVAVDVVDPFEVVDVEQEDDRSRPATSRSRQLRRDRVDHVPAVEQLGQRVGERAALSLGACLLRVHECERVLAPGSLAHQHADERERDRAGYEQQRADRDVRREHALDRHRGDDQPARCGAAGEAAVGQSAPVRLEHRRLGVDADELRVGRRSTRAREGRERSGARIDEADLRAIGGGRARRGDRDLEAEDADRPLARADHR